MELSVLNDFEFTRDESLQGKGWTYNIKDSLLQRCLVSQAVRRPGGPRCRFEISHAHPSL